MKTSPKNLIRQYFPHLLLLIMGILYYLPRFFMDGIPHYLNEDTWFHLNRIIGLQNVFQSPVSFLNFAHNGPMVNIFYPWLTMYPAHIFYKLTGSYVLAYKIFYLFLAIVTLFLAYFVMFRISKNRFSAFSFAILYTYSNFFFIDVFRRAHLGSALTTTALLFVLLGLYEICFGERKNRLPLAFGMALIGYSHNISLLMAAMLAGLYVLISFRFWDQKKERVLSLLKAAGAALLLLCGSFISIVYYMKTNPIYTPGGSGDGLQSTAFPLGMNLLSSLKNEPVSYAAGLWVIVSLTGLLLFYGKKAAAPAQTKTNRAIDCFAFAGLLLFLSASSLLPWKLLGDHTPLYMIQFVWRINAHSTLFLTAAFAFYLPQLLKPKKACLCGCALICLLAPVLHYSAILKLRSEENTRIFESDIDSGDAITFDYTNRQAKLYRNEHGYDMDNVYINREAVPAEVSYSPDGSVYQITIDVPPSDGEGVTADIPVFWYAQQKCLVNGKEIQTGLSERGATLVPLEPDGVSTISISYRHSALTFLSWGISLVTLAALLLFRRKGTFSAPEE